MYEENTMKKLVILSVACIASLCFFSLSHGQMTDSEKNNWLMSVIFKLEKMKEAATVDIREYDEEIKKCDLRISRSENILNLARQKGNEPAEAVAREALAKARDARKLNLDNRSMAELNRKRVEKTLASVKSGGRHIEATVEQVEFETMHAEWKKKQNQLIDQRLVEPNKNASAIHRSLMSNVPPLPGKNFNELQPGDVLLLEGKEIAKLDTAFTSGGSPSIASHTVVYLKTVNGKKLFLDNQPFQGPRIITEEEFLQVYGRRTAEVARLAEPLSREEGQKLFSAAVKMAQENRQEVSKSWFGSPLLGSNYGAWGKDDIVCSEADWALINNAGRNIPRSGDQVKVSAGVDFSPADYTNSPYFIVTPLGLPR